VIGSNSGAVEPKLADGIRPMEPTRAAAASLKMSPNMLEVSITSTGKAQSQLHRRIVHVHMLEFHGRKDRAHRREVRRQS